MVLLAIAGTTSDTNDHQLKKYFIILCLLVAASVQAQLKIAPVFADNMVIQRDRPFRVTGLATPGAQVQVSFSGSVHTAIAGKDSVWRVSIPSMSASWEPAVMQAHSGHERIVISNILIGDRWICLGQSNMELPIQREMHFSSFHFVSENERPRLYNPTYAGKNIFNAKYTDSVIFLLKHGQFYKGSWEVPDSVNIRSMSAVAWYFGEKICMQTHVPAGLINLSIGGAPLETFIDINALKKNKRFSAKADTGWLHNPALPIWIRERGMQNVADIAGVPADELGLDHAYKPGFAFREGIEPLLALPCKGMIWYQGESNAQEPDRVSEYGDLFAFMATDYRKKWNDPAMPCYWVQLSSIDTVKYKGQLWGWFRDEQRKMLEKIPHSGMAVCSDIGFRNDVHPTDKKTVGERLARWALLNDYHQQTIPSGPLPVEAVWKNGKVTVQFRYAGDGLQTNGTDTLHGFSSDGIHTVDAYIRTGSIEIPLTMKPAFIYYGWRSWSDGNLVNSEGLPASTFKIPVR